MRKYDAISIRSRDSLARYYHPTNTTGIDERRGVTYRIAVLIGMIIESRHDDDDLHHVAMVNQLHASREIAEHITRHRMTHIPESVIPRFMFAESRYDFAIAHMTESIAAAIYSMRPYLCNGPCVKCEGLAYAMGAVAFHGDFMLAKRSIPLNDGKFIAPIPSDHMALPTLAADEAVAVWRSSCPQCGTLSTHEFHELHDAAQACVTHLRSHALTDILAGRRPTE